MEVPRVWQEAVMELYTAAQRRWEAGERDGNSDSGETADGSLPASGGGVGDVHPVLRQRAGVVGEGEPGLVSGERGHGEL